MFTAVIAALVVVAGIAAAFIGAFLGAFVFAFLQIGAEVSAVWVDLFAMMAVAGFLGFCVGRVRRVETRRGLVIGCVAYVAVNAFLVVEVHQSAPLTSALIVGGLIALGLLAGGLLGSHPRRIARSA